MRAANNEGLGPWSEPSQPVRTLTERPPAPRAPAISLACPPPGPLSLWLSLFLPDENGGDPVTAMLLETRRHGGTQPPEWSRCERHPVPADADQRCARRSNATIRKRGGRGSGTFGHRRVGAGAGAGIDGAPSTTRPATTTACCEVIVLVEGLQPRTYYSFRASAVNARGASNPGPPCRRIRTSAPRPPSWTLAHDGNSTATTTLAVAPQPAKHTAGDLGGKEGSKREGGGVSGGGTAHAAADLPCAHPRAACSGLGACTVLWAEPFSNGAAIELYMVEAVRLGPEVVSLGIGATDKGKEDEGIDDKNNGEDKGVHEKNGHDHAAAAAKATRLKKKDEESHVMAMARPSSPPPPPPDVLVLPAPERTGRDEGDERDDRAREEGGEVVREVMQRFHRSVPSQMRYLVVRGLVTGGDYVFRVAASNEAGTGEAGPWTQVVRVVDPADEA